MSPSPVNPFDSIVPVNSLGIHNAFEESARKWPARVALNYDEDSISYEELNRRANRLAHYLIECGVGPEVPVALWLERSPLLVVAILAVLKAGGCYVPVDLAYPADRVTFMFQDSQSPVLLTESHLLKSLGATPARVLCLDSQPQEFANHPDTNPAPRARADNAAYIIYTSGSTGKPKGVIVTHHNVVRLLRSTEHWFRFNQEDVWVLFHSYAFDMSVWELWGALFYGGRLVIARYLVTRSPGDFYELLAREKVTVLNQTPSALRQLIWAETAATTRPQLALRLITCGGEALELQMLKPWFERHGDQSPVIVNMYGITETTVHTTYRPIRSADLESGVGSVIGVPIPDLQVHLLDCELRPVAQGEPGEICVGGAGVARGYLNRPELTSERFLDDPFTKIPGARLYRSGDLARVNAHGEMEYLGRIDHQVKIRGFRIELGEIESALNRHPRVKGSVVLTREDNTGEKRLFAYIVAVGDRPSGGELRTYLGTHLPDYMIPSGFVFLEAFPLNHNGKVDRPALPEPPPGRPDLANELIPPRTLPEQQLARVWQSVLGIETVGVHDNFFELGGDSIRCISVVAQARQAGLELSLQDVFHQPTIATLAPHAVAPNETPPPPPAFSLISAEDRAGLPSTAKDAYPISRLQLGMFYHNELDPISAVYHDVFSFRIRAPFDRAKLRAALNSLILRHPLLRTSFHLTGYSVPLQIVHRHAPLIFTVEDLGKHPAIDQEKSVQDWIQAEKRRPFDRTIAPLVRFHAQLQGPQSFQFFVSFHHCCIDGWSLASLVTEVFQHYAALLRGAPIQTTAPAATYREFVALEQASIASPSSRSFWQQKLSQASPQRLPRWPVALETNQHEQVRSREYYLHGPVLDGLKALAQQAGVPFKTVLLAAHQRVLAALHGTREVLTGLVSNGRPETIDAERVIGLFLNTVPFRQVLPGGSWVDLARQTFAAEQDILPHRRFPLSEAQKLSGGVPLFETAFDFVHFHVLRKLDHCGGIGFTEGAYFEANNLTAYTTFMLDVSSSRLELHIDFDPRVLCPEQVERMCGHYLNVLHAMAADPTGNCDQLQLLSAPEYRQVLTDWNNTVQDYERDQCVHQLIERCGQTRPDAIAVACGPDTLTYRELDARAGSLARQLAGLGLGPGAIVGVCLPRSTDMLVALLGVMKAGAAYLPLDPDFPRARLQYMLTDSRASVLVTERELVGLIEELPAKIVCLDELLADPVAADNAPVQPRLPVIPEPSDLAYVIYTSGSTGKPKGVQIEHRSLVNLLRSVGRIIGFGTADHLLAVTTLSFDIAALELFLPLISGGRVTLVPREIMADGQQLCSLLEKSGATVMQGTPTTWRFLIEAGWPGKPDLKIIVGGEALKRELADNLLARAATVWNFYGPTETTVWSTCWKVRRTGPICIGQPLANTRAYVLDAGLLPVPIGTPGELYLGGHGVARGYLNQPELTADKFVSDPFTAEPGATMYRTGDLVRWLPDGNIEWLGRMDQQVKIRGFRIEPGEIESVLRQHSAIADALVTTRQDPAGDARLIGYLLTRNGPPQVSELRDFIRSRLPHYMVPAQFVLLKKFPLTPNGKINVRELPAPETAAAAPGTYTPPEGKIEERVACIWGEVLALNQVGAEDNFFELGGDSLSGTRAFARLNQEFRKEITLREFFEQPTVRRIAALIQNREPSAPATLATIPRQPRLVIKD